MESPSEEGKKLSLSQAYEMSDDLFNAIMCTLQSCQGKEVSCQ